MLAVFPPIFVADTKIIYGYNFVAPLKYLLYINLKHHLLTSASLNPNSILLHSIIPNNVSFNSNPLSIYFAGTRSSES